MSKYLIAYKYFAGHQWDALESEIIRRKVVELDSMTIPTMSQLQKEIQNSILDPENCEVTIVAFSKFD